MFVVQEYVFALQEKYATGETSEHSFRKDLEFFLEKLLPDKKGSNYRILNEAKQKKGLRPDILILENDVPIGYIECKDIGKSLNDPLTKAQVKKYFDGGLGDNFILTNYTEFLFYRNNELRIGFDLASITGQGSLLNGGDNDFIHSDSQNKTKWLINKSDCEKLENALKSFFTDCNPVIRTSKDLSEKMASKARTMRDAILGALQDSDNKDSALERQYHGFKRILIHDMSIESFADIYAQTVTYGLFAARLHDKTLNDFSLSEALKLLPLSNPFLKNLFKQLADDTDERISWIIQDLIGFFRASDLQTMLANYGESTRLNDPMIHFYEDFLRDYDKTTRKARGVWYTPESIVDFIVRGVDDILKTEFELKDGLADYSRIDVKVKNANGKDEKKSMHRVQVLDPATGTGTFLAHTVKHILESMRGGSKSAYIKEHLVKRIHGFEILMASYTMAHIKLDMLLGEHGYTPSSRLNIYLTNALEEAYPVQDLPLFAEYIAEEANSASDIKRNYPIMVMIGNPPYSGESQNKGEHIMNLMSDYKREPKTKLKLQEKNSKWLNDDYVKFIRLAQKFVTKNGQGVVGFITAHGYLDNPTFRGMRYNLLCEFDKIYALDLHGNAKKKETCPDGSKDDNVFDIQQGVAIILAVKNDKSLQNDDTVEKKNKLATIYHADLYGKRSYKDKFLFENNLQSITWQKIDYDHPMYFFVPKNNESKKEYDKGFGVNVLFGINNVGIVTARDNFTIHLEEEKLQETIDKFLSMDDEQARHRFGLGKDVRDWKVSYARKDLDKKDGNIVKINYRPFDKRYTYYTGRSKGFHCYPRNDVMQHFIKGDNFGLLIGRQGQVVGNMSWNLAFISQEIADLNIYYRGGGNYFPLYLYNEPQQQTQEFFFGEAPPKNRIANFDEKILKKFIKGLGLKYIPDHKEDEEKLNSPPLEGCLEEAGWSYHKNQTKTTPSGSACHPSEGGEFEVMFKKLTVNPLDILDYIYGVLHSPKYREKYKEFLKTDFPKIPYPDNKNMFWKLVLLGREIRLYHLLEHPNLENAKDIITFPLGGDDIITRKISSKNDFIITDEAKKIGRIMINDTQYFDNIPLTAWEFYIGGYQPVIKWLKDRSSRKLSFEDIQHYPKIIYALIQTERLMQEIDKIEFLE